MSVISEVPGQFSRGKKKLEVKICDRPDNHTHDSMFCWTHDTGVVRCTTSPRTCTSCTSFRTRRVVRLRWDRDWTGECTKYALDTYSIDVVKETTPCGSCASGIHTNATVTTLLLWCILSLSWMSFIVVTVGGLVGSNSGLETMRENWWSHWVTVWQFVPWDSLSPGTHPVGASSIRPSSTYNPPNHGENPRWTKKKTKKLRQQLSEVTTSAFWV